jgi:uncharacterized membrane protein
MTSDNAASKPPAAGRKLRIALIVSLALNVLVIGGVAGTLLVSRHHGWKGHGDRAFGLLGFARTLPPERAELIRQRIASEKANLSALRKAERQARDEARSILMEEPFDAEKFKAALSRAAEAEAKEKSARMSLLAETAAGLTPEERRQLHNWFEKRRARSRRDRYRKPPQPSP